jgi:phosphohistidine phosphatase
MLIYILRHGDAVQSSSLHDSERPLSDLGQQQASAVGEFVQSVNLHPDVIISSPLIRAVKTAEAIRRSANVAQIQMSEYLIPGTRKEQLIEQLNKLGRNSVLLVGHEPHLSQTISFLLTGRENLPVEVRKCSLACLLASDPVRPGHALLQWLVSVEQMDAFRRMSGRS